MSYVPDMGDVVILDFNPQAGHEQAGKRPAVVLSPANFNSTTGFAWVCPVTNQQKGYPFEIGIRGANKTTGVILVDQMKSLDWNARSLHKVDKVSGDCLNDIKDIVRAILNL